MDKDEAISALREQDIDGQQRAARALYRSPDGADRMRDTAVADAVRSSVAGGNRSGSAILLLGHDESPDAVAVLHQVRDDTSGKGTKVDEWGPIVPLALVANVALSRLGDTDARRALLEAAGGSSLESLAFLLQSLDEIDDPSIIHALRPTLDDERPVKGGVPSGGQPSRRLSDLAVDALTDRLGLKLGFELNSAGRYSPDERAAVAKALTSSVPR